MTTQGENELTSTGRGHGYRPVDTTRPHPARRYDYWLGGKDNFAADRQSADDIAEAFPAIRTAAIENRRFLCRAVESLTRRCGIRQFLDIGTGIPTSPNVHEIAQAIAPHSRVVYVDNDPIVVAHGRALTVSARPGAATYLRADLRHPETILTAPELRDTLDLRQPVALLLVAVLHFMDDADDPYPVVARLIEALSPGSYLVLSHATYDPLPADIVARLVALTDGNDAAHGTFRPRTRAEVTRFLAGLTVLEPGVASIVDWWPRLAPRPGATDSDAAMYGAVARLP